VTLSHLHLLLNHVPVLGTYFGLVCLALSLLLKSVELQRIALVIFVLVGVLAIPVYLTGPHAAETVRTLPEVSHEHIQTHSTFGLASLLLAVFVGIRSAFAFFSLRRRGRLSGYNMASLTILAVLLGILMGWTASVGGKIRRPEIRYSRTLPPSQSGAQLHSVWKVPSRSVRS
jgi:hypothetical protein